MKNQKPKNLIIFFLAIVIFAVFGVVENSEAADYYLSPTGSDSGDGSISEPWKSLDYALDPRLNGGVARVDGGDGEDDTLYLRGGVYDCSSMTTYNSVIGSEIFPNNSETDATVTIKSYPSEWAILDGTGLNHVIRIDSVMWNVVFENFEVRNAYRYGIDGEHDAGGGQTQVNNCTFRNLYIHDNNKDEGVNPAGNNPAGLLMAAKDTTVEYCTFKDNGVRDGVTPMHNAANLTIFQCYNTDNTNVDPYPRRNNIIQYNIFDGAATSIKDKAYGNFVDSATPSIRNSDWKSLIHHNVFLNFDIIAYYARQDFAEFYSNLVFMGSANRGFYYAEHDDIPSKGCWELKVFNNTFIGGHGSIYVDISNYSGGYDHEIYNNLFLSPTDNSVVLWSGQTNTWDITFDHNGYDNDNSTIANYLDDGSRTFAQWQVYGYDAGSLFESLSVEADYTLSAGSSAIGAGRSGIDLGAFPYGEESWYSLAGATITSTDTTPPSHPTGLSVE